MIPWLFGVRDVASEKNGQLRIVRWLGKEAVIGDGVFQSGRYMQRVFGGMLGMLPGGFAPKRILLLGLGAGGCVPVIRRRFRTSHIVAVEYDPVMVELARETYLRRGDGGLEVIQGDVRDVLPGLQTEFDLILVDLFCGRRVAPAVSEPKVLAQIDRLLSWRGYLLVNLFRELDTFSPAIEEALTLHGLRRVKRNYVALYRHRGMGKIGEGAPDGFEDREHSPGYLRLVTPDWRCFSLIHDSGGVGTRLQVGPFAFDKFVQAQQPDLRPTGRFRIVCWQPYMGKPSRGWWRLPSILSTHFLRGVAVLDNEKYWDKWSSHAKRHRAKFLEGGAYEVVEVNLATFACAYHATRFLDPLTRRSFIGVLRHHLARHSQDVHLTVAREIDGGRIVSGLATIDYADISQSDHVIAFVHPDAQNTSVGVGLIDHWHARCLRAGIRFLNFGLLRRPGDPRSWQGYTNFKRQFHLYEILYPYPCWRIVLPKRRVI